MMTQKRGLLCHVRTLMFMVLLGSSSILSVKAGGIVKEFSKDLQGYCNQAKSVYSKKLLIKLMKARSIDSACARGSEIEKLTSLCRNQNGNKEKCKHIIALFKDVKAKKSGAVFGQ